MKKFVGSRAAALLAAAALVASASAQVRDGANIQADAALGGLANLAVQDTPTGYGDATVGNQAADFGSELDGMWATISGGSLKLSITGNLQANFNKMWIFLDARAGGESTLLGDNVDGGFNEIQQMTGMTFDVGFEPEQGLRLEIGGGFYGINHFDLSTNSAYNVWAGGGPADLPAVNRVGGGGIAHGWDNSNNVGVDGVSAAAALSADKGWELDIPLATLGNPAATAIGITAFITSGSGDNMSNQVLPGIQNVAGNLGNPGGVNFNGIPGNQYGVAVPEPTSLIGLVLAGLLLRRR